MNAEELEVGRRNLLAQLRHDLRRDLTEYPVDAATMRELVQVLEGLAPPSREQVDKFVSDWFRHTLTPEARDMLADAVLNLMGGVKP